MTELIWGLGRIGSKYLNMLFSKCQEVDTKRGRYWVTRLLLLLAAAGDRVGILIDSVFSLIQRPDQEATDKDDYTAGLVPIHTQYIYVQ